MYVSAARWQCVFRTPLYERGLLVAGKAPPACECMGRREAEVWQCRSTLARGLIVRRCLTHFAAGFKAWAYVLFTSLACLLGLWSLPPTMHRWATPLAASSKTFTSPLVKSDLWLFCSYMPLQTAQAHAGSL